MSIWNSSKATYCIFNCLILKTFSNNLNYLTINCIIYNTFKSGAKLQKNSIRCSPDTEYFT